MVMVYTVLCVQLLHPGSTIPMVGKITKFVFFIDAVVENVIRKIRKLLMFSVSIEQYFNVQLFSRLTLTLSCEFSLQK